MNPLHLVVVVCLAAHPNECSRLQPQVTVTSESGCFLTGEMYAAHWLPEHLDWVLDRIDCSEGWSFVPGDDG